MVHIPEIPNRTEQQTKTALALYDRIESLINEVTNQEKTFLYNSQIDEIFMSRLAHGDPADGGDYLGEIDLFGAGMTSKEIWQVEDEIQNQLKDAPRGTWLTLRKGFSREDGDVIFYQPMVAMGCLPPSKASLSKGLGLGSTDHVEARPTWAYVYARMIEGDIAGTRTWMREERIRESVEEAAKRLALAPGHKLGTLVFNDGKVTRACEVKDAGVGGHGVVLHGRRGAQLVQLTTNALNVDGAIKRAHEEGRRDNSRMSAPAATPAAMRMR